MKTLKIILSLVLVASSLTVSSSENLYFKNNLLNNGGMTGAGGGEYIVDENNPWFMGDREILWCIDHGGEKNFSLPFEEAKKEIQASLNDIFNQIQFRKLFGSTDGLYYQLVNFLVKDSAGKYYTTDDHLDPQAYFLSYRNRYEQNCDQADLKFILGNINSREANDLKSAYGSDRFRRIGAMTVRTSYNSETNWARGYIYVAADRGPLAYSGDKNKVIKFPNLWDNHLNVSDQAPIPPITNNGHTAFDPKAYKLKEQMISPLRAVLTHEIGHIIGLNHTDVGVQDGGLNSTLGEFYNVMDQDFPASIIRNGFIYKGHYQFLKNFIMRGTYSGTLGTSWHVNMALQGQDFNWIVQDIFDLGDSPERQTLSALFGVKAFDDFYKKSFTFFLDPKWDHLGIDPDYKRHLHVMSVRKDSTSYSHESKIQILDDSCYVADPPRVYYYPILKDFISFRVEEEDSDSAGPLVYNSSTGSWESQANPTSVSQVKTFPLLKFVDRKFCYKVNIAGHDYEMEFRKTFTGIFDKVTLYYGSPLGKKFLSFYITSDGGFELQPYLSLNFPKYVPFFKIGR